MIYKVDRSVNGTSLVVPQIAGLGQIYGDLDDGWMFTVVFTGGGEFYLRFLIQEEAQKELDELSKVISGYWKTRK